MAQVAKIGQSSMARPGAVGGRPVAGKANIANAERVEVEEVAVETAIGDLPSGLSFNQYSVLPSIKKPPSTETVGTFFSGIFDDFSALIDAQAQMSEGISSRRRPSSAKVANEMVAGVRIYETNIVSNARRVDQSGNFMILA